ncbi:type VI secretion system-associated FHA domain protein TagH [Pseudacidovorax sp. RU35E]|uniref:type VI secretion system-associated FHA domain protein TagH n=1 Tax=Pseudacidovorax sp. RU35E TaxID=1907403 RepID=UPI0009541D62|nr:type VI secretion system-associated FHA domain protein TagH [Pseudacidovorax sp. RU35E]SIR54945.1 FHA domain protein [Pseudacidovorax sp. RU35E]
MIEIVVVGRQGAPMGRPLAARFGPQGGTIGRSDTNTLVLDDPDRTVSRVHAQVLCRNGQYVIVDRGSNPMQCNGVPLGAGNEAALQGGERLVIGSFELAVQRLQAAAPLAATADLPTGFGAPPAAAPALPDDDPFADLLAGLGPASPPPARPAAPTPPAAPAAALPAAFADPMGLSPRAGTPSADDPFAGLLGAAPAGAAPLDDFSDLGLPAASNPTANSQRIDDLFGLGPASTGGDPLALSPLADPLLQPNTAGSAADPLAAFQQGAPASQAPRSDHAPIGQFGFTPPRAAMAPAMPASPATPPVPGGQAFPDAAGEPIRIGRATAPRPALPPDAAPAVAAFAPPPAMAPTPPAAGAAGVPDPFADLLGDEPFGSAAATGGGLDDLLAPAPAPAVASAAVPLPAPAPFPAPAPAPASAWSAPPAAAFASHPAAPAMAPTPMAAAGGDAGELLAAFLHGLGGMHQPPTQLTPALMERIGVMLRSATEGTLQLLLTRQELKREVRAEVTMIAAQANNPLKFSPTVEVALGHLLGPQLRGFMPADAAMRDAYDDLRAHQFGVMVGLRAALAALIARFGPEELEKKIAARSALDSLFAANRKAKLWDQFTALYGAIAAEAEDDFHSLFGKAFLEAYEAQMARLKQQAGEGGAQP